MENKVLLSDIVLKWLRYREALQNGEATAEQVEEFDKIFPQILVKDYLPMAQKENLVAQIVWYTFDKQADETYIDYMTNFEICLILYGLLGYTTIENDLQMAALSSAIVDILYECGFVDKILNFCKKDYERLCTMADRAVNFRTGLELINSIATFDPQQLQELAQELKNTLGGLTPETVRGLVKIAQINDPATLAVAEALDKFGVLKTKEDVEQIINTEK
jgi:DNA-directed RNA polymerase subunit F